MQETNESLGTYLKRTREEKNVSIEQVAYATRISLKMLRALEEDDHTSLPAPTFVRGYLQAYAKYVRIDTQDLLLRYQHHLATAPDAKRSAIRSHYLYVRERYQEKRRLVLVIVLFVTMLSVAGAYFFLKAQREKHKRLAKTAEQIQKGEENKPPLPAAVEVAGEKEKGAEKPAEKTPPADEKANAPALAQPTPPPPPAPPAAPPAPAPAPKPEAKAAPAAPPAPPAAPAPAPAAPAAAANTAEAKTYNLLLKANEDVWFRFQTDEDEVKDLTLRKDKQLMLRANKVIKIFSGNLGALKAKLNDKDISNLASGSRSKSVVLPESEAANFKLPLFPQFQVKSSGNHAATSGAPDANGGSQNGSSSTGTGNTPANPPAQ